MHAGDPNEPRSCGLQQLSDRAAVAEIGDRRPMPALLECCRDVFESKGFNAKERSEAKAIVARYGSQQQDVHTKSSEAIIQLSGRSSVCGETPWNGFWSLHVGGPPLSSGSRR